MANILIVDDSYAIRETLKARFMNFGHCVDVAINGEDAMKLYTEKIYHLVITDLVMPDQDGFEMIQKIRKNDPELVIVAMSGGGADKGKGLLNMAKLMGANYVYQKPFKFDEFIDSIHQIID